MATSAEEKLVRDILQRFRVGASWSEDLKEMVQKQGQTDSPSPDSSQILHPMHEENTPGVGLETRQD